VISFFNDIFMVVLLVPLVAYLPLNN